MRFLVMFVTAVCVLFLIRVEDFYAGMPGSKLPRHSGIFFQETCTLTTFVEQKLSLCVKKLRNFMRVYVNGERAV